MFDDAWDYEKDTWKMGKSPTELASSVREISEKPQYISDSGKLQKVLNDLMTKGIQIGSVRFDEVEMPILRDQYDKLCEILAAIRGGGPPDPMPGISEQTIREIAGGRQVLGEADSNTIMNYEGMPIDSSGMDEYRRLQRRYAEIIDGVDTRILGMSANNSILGGAGPGSFAVAVADGQFTPGESRNIEDSLNRLQTEIAILVRTLQANNDRENRDRETNVTINMSDY
jgi:hypothetical protein